MRVVDSKPLLYSYFLYFFICTTGVHSFVLFYVLYRLGTALRVLIATRTRFLSFRTVHEVFLNFSAKRVEISINYILKSNLV